MNMQKSRVNQYASFASFGRLGYASLALFLGFCVCAQTTSICWAFPQDPSKVTTADKSKTDQKAAAVKEEKEAEGSVIGIKNVCVHVMKLEKTLKLYREILGFKMSNASVLHGAGIEGMLVMELEAGNCKVHLSLPAPGGFGLKPIGNTNHNHFMLVVDNIVPICDKLKEEGYELENDNYARDKYSFFTGPNGEIVGLTEYK